MIVEQATVLQDTLWPDGHTTSQLGTAVGEQLSVVVVVAADVTSQPVILEVVVEHVFVVL